MNCNSITDLTPEQAIAATVGSGYGIDLAESFARPPETMVGECVYDEDGNHIGWITNAPAEPDEATMLKLHDRMNAVLLDMQEELLAYHPQDRENASSKELVDCVIRAHQIIEDAATVGAGTCRLVDNDSGPDMHCTACGGGVDDEYRYFMDSHGYSRCPHCGARIEVSE